MLWIEDCNYTWKNRKGLKQSVIWKNYHIWLLSSNISFSIFLNNSCSFQNWQWRNSFRSKQKYPPGIRSCKNADPADLGSTSLRPCPKAPWQWSLVTGLWNTETCKVRSRPNALCYGWYHFSKQKAEIQARVALSRKNKRTVIFQTQGGKGKGHSRGQGPIQIACHLNTLPGF